MTMRGTGVPASIVLYSHDGFGLGHLTRTVYLAQRIRAVEPDADITIMTSSPVAHRLRALHDFAWIKLPSVTKTGVERYRPHKLQLELDRVIALRSGLILTTLQHLQPELLIVDHRPLGLRGEARQALRWLRAYSPRTRTVVGLRDVVDEPRIVIRDWKSQGVYEALEALYDHVLVYGEQSIVDTARDYDLPPAVREKVAFTGYLGRGPATRSCEVVRRSLGLTGERLVVVHVGGGGDGSQVVETYIRSVALLPRDVFSLVVTGPLMDDAERRRLQELVTSPRVTLVEYQEDLASYISAADLSISMGGYNSICEVLSAGVPAIVVPRVFPRQEQYIRAQRLAMRGLLQLLPPSSLTPRSLADAALYCLGLPRRLERPLRLDGGEYAAHFFASVLRQESPREAESWAATV